MATPVSNTHPLTGSPFIDGLVQGGSWQFSGPRVITYSLHTLSGGVWAQFQIDVAAQVAQAWSNVANITFQLVGNGGDPTASTTDVAVTLTDGLVSTAPFAGFAVFPDPNVGNAILAAAGLTRSDYPRIEGDVVLDNSNVVFGYLNPGGAGFEAAMHEVGHALGLKHPHDDGGNGRPTFSSRGISAYDNERWTVMSYNSEGGGLSSGNVATPMPLDILAIQHIYGANMSYRAGDDTYFVGVGQSSSFLQTIWDAGGIDTFRGDSGMGGSTIDLRPGAFTNNYAIAYNVTIENGIGTNFNDTLTGNDAANTLDGRNGDDAMRGGLGNDTYVVNSLGDVVVENPGEGNDTIVTPFSFNVAGTNVENVTLSGYGNVNATGDGANNTLFGNSARNLLQGLAGDDDLWGGDGNDQLFGGLGDDALNGGGANDVLDPGAGGNTLNGGVGMDSALFGARAGYDVTYSNGAISVTETATATVSTVTDVEYLRFSDSLLLGKATSTEVDFGSDGRSDILLRNLDTGVIEIRTVNGTTPTGSSVVTFLAPPNDWTIAGTGDFNGDGQGEILWRQDAGLVAIWQMDGSTFTGGAGVLAPSNDWQIVGTGDFDGDTKDDILWRHDTGTIGIWDMDGLVLTGGGIVLPASNDWRVTGTGDFDGDAKTDILWQHDSGLVGMWLMDGLALRGGGALFAPPNAWRIMGTGDFNGDAKSDVLWRHDNGDVGIWEMDGVNLAGGGVTQNVANTRTMVGVGDFNADNRSDVLWQDTSGSLSVELLDNLSSIDTGTIGTLATDWFLA